jgi:hypothetical protein
VVLCLADSLFVSPLITIAGVCQRISGIKQCHTDKKGIERLTPLRTQGKSFYGETFIAEEILQTIEGTKQ